MRLILLFNPPIELLQNLLDRCSSTFEIPAVATKYSVRNHPAFCCSRVPLPVLLLSQEEGGADMAVAPKGRSERRRTHSSGPGKE